MTYLESKPRYEILDGLRGVAAMIVVAFHLFETYSPGPSEQIINHGYLAVDYACDSGREHLHLINRYRLGLPETL